MMEQAIPVVAAADIFIVVGTSLVIYPAAGLIHYTRRETPKYVVNPNHHSISGIQNLTIIRQNATTGVDELVRRLMD